MKKFLILFLAIVGFAITANAQNVVIQQNGTTTSNTQTSDPNILYINGIPSTADIGGVDVQDEWSGPVPYAGYKQTIIFKNYNDFPVTVLYSVITGKKEKIGSIVLEAKGKKSIVTADNWDGRYITSVATIVRKL